MAERLICRIYRVRGRVQGVGFRNFVQRAANDIGVHGYARNLDDGSVEVFGQGGAHQMEELEAQLWRGPRWSEVFGVDREETGPRELNGFSIRP
jgi:acylphosphatase